MLETVETFIKLSLRYAQTATYGTPSQYFDQAFGAVQCFIMVHPEYEADAIALWDTYKPLFEAEIYGA